MNLPLFLASTVSVMHSPNFKFQGGFKVLTLLHISVIDESIHQLDHTYADTIL